MAIAKKTPAPKKPRKPTKAKVLTGLNADTVVVDDPHIVKWFTEPIPAQLPSERLRCQSAGEEPRMLTNKDIDFLQDFLMSVSPSPLTRMLTPNADADRLIFGTLAPIVEIIRQCVHKRNEVKAEQKRELSHLMHRGDLAELLLIDFWSVFHNYYAHTETFDVRHELLKRVLAHGAAPGYRGNWDRLAMVAELAWALVNT